MNILIPVDTNDMDNGKIVLINDAKKWALIDFDLGKIQAHKFYDSKDDISDFIEILIVKDQNEDVENFLQEGTVVLVAPLQMYIEDVMEAFLFKELHDLDY